MLCAELVGESIVLVGTVDWFVHAFHVDLRYVQEKAWIRQMKPQPTRTSEGRLGGRGGDAFSRVILKLEPLNG